jgi:hypothetical protein
MGRQAQVVDPGQLDGCAPWLTDFRQAIAGPFPVATWNPSQLDQWFGEVGGPGSSRMDSTRLRDSQHRRSGHIQVRRRHASVWYTGRPRWV